MTRSSRLPVRRLVALVTVVALGACGISANSDPQPIASRDLPDDLVDPNPASSTTLPEGTGTTTVPVCLIREASDGVTLVAVDREVTRATVPHERLAALFGGPTEDESKAGITTRIPADTELLDVATDEDGEEVMVDLSEDFFSIEGEALAQAFAQIVYTATEAAAGGYRQVRFSLDGETISVLDGDGTEQEGAVSRSDYRSFGPCD